MSQDPPELNPDQRTAIHRVQQVESLTRPELDELPFGVIQVDRDGVVLAYNATEAKLAELDPDDVVGKNSLPKSRRAPTWTRPFVNVNRNGNVSWRRPRTTPSRNLLPNVSTS